MDIINKWLTGRRNYQVGVAIYKTIGADQKLKDLFAKGKTDFSARRLTEVLTELLNKPLAAVSIPISEETSRMPESNNPVLMAIRDQWLIPYQRMNYLRHQLDSIKGNSPEAIALRKPIVFEILDLEQECMQIWDKRRQYEKTGKLPEVTKDDFEVPIDPAALARFIEAAKKAIRNNLRKMKNEPGKPIYAQLVEQHKARYKAATGNDYETKN
jgi:hypothetical protein